MMVTSYYNNNNYIFCTNFNKLFFLLLPWLRQIGHAAKHNKTPWYPVIVPSIVSITFVVTII